VLYQKLTDRSTGQLAKPSITSPSSSARRPCSMRLEACAPLVYHDGRHQLWIEGRHDAKVVLEETGVIYVYPDDLSFRDVLAEHGVREGDDKNVGDRDYVRVNFLAEADALEDHLAAHAPTCSAGIAAKTLVCLAVPPHDVVHDRAALAREVRRALGIEPDAVVHPVAEELPVADHGAEIDVVRVARQLHADAYVDVAGECLLEVGAHGDAIPVTLRSMSATVVRSTLPCGTKPSSVTEIGAAESGRTRKAPRRLNNRASAGRELLLDESRSRNSRP
jgi:hypothetical protein